MKPAGRRFVAGRVCLGGSPVRWLHVQRPQALGCVLRRLRARLAPLCAGRGGVPARPLAALGGGLSGDPQPLAADGARHRYLSVGPGTTARRSALCRRAYAPRPGGDRLRPRLARLRVRHPALALWRRPRLGDAAANGALALDLGRRRLRRHHDGVHCVPAGAPRPRRRACRRAGRVGPRARRALGDQREAGPAFSFQHP